MKVWNNGAWQDIEVPDGGDDQINVIINVGGQTIAMIATAGFAIIAALIAIVVLIIALNTTEPQNPDPPGGGNGNNPNAALMVE